MLALWRCRWMLGQARHSCKQTSERTRSGHEVVSGLVQRVLHSTDQLHVAHYSEKIGVWRTHLRRCDASGSQQQLRLRCGSVTALRTAERFHRYTNS